MTRHEQPRGNSAVGTYNAVAAMKQNGLPDTARRERSRSFWKEQPSASFSPWLPEGMKEDIAATQLVFTVLDVRTGEADQGPFWACDVELPNGQRFSMAFGKAEFRDESMTTLQAVVKQVGSIECTLEAFDAKMGRGYRLAEPPYEDDAESPIGMALDSPDSVSGSDAAKADDDESAPPF